MLVRMRIEWVAPKQLDRYVLARALESAEFRLSPASTLGGFAIEPILSQPRALKEDGSPDLEIFAFVLRNSSDIAKLRVGEEVLLNT